MKSKILRSIRKLSSKEKISNSQETLQLLLRRAKKMAALGQKEALEDLQRLALRQIQSRHMVDAYLKPDHHAIDPLSEWNDVGITFIPSIKKSLIDFLLDGRRINKGLLPTAKLGRDIVLPTCWHPFSIIHMLGKIGEGRKCGMWSQDPNHSIHYWYPLNIFWVAGGNHSITQGILLAEGEVKASEGYNLSDLYKYVFFNGDSWIDADSGATLGIPRYKEIGYVYEVGRFICQL
ncbi:DUF6710 family protein [Microbulbifer epialgicus]|uniref:DUF6710 family protein n=1 Tax=Microbulbifer epialgicus TaxID=393907 RepID=A0ABV4P5V3_9GAMM